MRRALFASPLLLACVIAGCVSPPGTLEVDAGPGYRRDGSPSPVFRRCGGDGGSASDAACGDGEVPMPMEDAGPPPPPCNETTFELFAPDADSVWLSGSFLAPSPGAAWPTSPAEGALELVDDGAGTWSVTHLVEPIGRHTYKLIVTRGADVQWIPDPANDAREPDGFGSFNSVIDVCAASCGDVDAFDWRDSVMYFVMVDRFRDSDGAATTVPGASDDGRTSGQYEGGDLQGVTDQIPYLAELGVTAIWLSAPYENRDIAGGALDGRDTHQYSAYHGYWPSPANVQYTAGHELASGSPSPEVESRIGDELDLHALVDTAHATTSADGDRMKVLFDYVMKHVDVESGLYQANRSWFIEPVRTCADGDVWNDPYWGTRCSFTTYLPSFDYYQPAVRAWSISDAIWWATEYGIDGYRLDAIKHVPLEWLTDLRDAVEAEIPAPPGDRFYMVGETFTYSQGEIRPFVDPETMLDGQFDFPFKEQACRALFRGELGMDGLASWMDANDAFYPRGSIMSPFVGNHDIPRAIHFANGEFGCTQGSDYPINWNPAAYPQPSTAAPYERMEVAFAVMMTNPGIPLVYYGDEIGLAGGGDPDNRRPMVWDEAALNPHQRALRDTVSTLGRIRGEHPVVGRGRRVTVSADADTWVYRMTGCAGAGAGDVLVAINRADTERTVTIPPGSYEDLVTGGAATAGSTTLAPRSFRILGAM